MQRTANRSVYFHGLPGGPEELAAIGCALPNVIAPDRRHDASLLSLDAYCDHLSAAIAQQAGGAHLTLIGFSAGTRIALEVAVRLADRVDQIVLISAAAPLECGDFLPLMAGRPVFRTAQRSALMFGALSRAQGALNNWMPDRLFAAMFASVSGADSAYACDPLFRYAMREMIGETLRDGAPGYRREILGYVASWAQLLPRVSAPVILWHGSEDNWTPPAMAEALAARLPHVRAVHHLPGLSHYSTLAAVLKGDLTAAASKAVYP